MDAPSSAFGNNQPNAIGQSHSSFGVNVYGHGQYVHAHDESIPMLQYYLQQATQHLLRQPGDAQAAAHVQAFQQRLANAQARANGRVHLPQQTFQPRRGQQVRQFPRRLRRRRHHSRMGLRSHSRG